MGNYIWSGILKKHIWVWLVRCPHTLGNRVYVNIHVRMVHFYLKMQIYLEITASEFLVDILNLVTCLNSFFQRNTQTESDKWCVIIVMASKKKLQYRIHAVYSAFNMFPFLFRWLYTLLAWLFTGQWTITFLKTKWVQQPNDLFRVLQIDI